MKDKKPFLKRIIKKKSFWIILVAIILIAGYLILKPNSNLKNIITEKAELTNLKQTVLATGQVVSDIDLALSFNTSGTVKKINVAVGDKVRKGTVLATLDQAQVKADLTTAKGSLATAQARLEKTTEGASSQRVALAQIAVDNAERDYNNIKKTQETLVNSAYYNLLNSTPKAIPAGGISDYTAPTISGNYKLGKSGTINIATYYSGDGTVFTVSGLTLGNGVVTTTTPQPLGDSGLSITFPSTTNLNSNNWVITIPNKQAPNYLSNYNAYQVALKTKQSVLAQAQATVDQAKAQYAVTTAGARDSDIKLAQAGILSAQGQYEQALARYNNTKIFAPTDGTITSVDIKLGELAQPSKEVIVLQDISNMYVEANINEANIVDLAIGMPVDITFDSFGPDRLFKGKIFSIDPGSTLLSGVVNYKIKVSLDQKIAELKPGMTANMTIKVEEKNNVIAVPVRAITTNSKGKSTIKLITDLKKKKYKEVPVTLGLNGDGGLDEITSGLSVGDEFVTLIKTK